jgi:membrane carboxypeptidase/penicillin-binding protein
MEEVKILTKEDNWYQRKIKEALMILRHKPSLNKDRDLELPPFT